VVPAPLLARLRGLPQVRYVRVLRI